MEQDTELRILNTARKHFIQKGFSATRMQEIADEAGINKALLHYYFRSKEKLYQEIVSRTLQKAIPRFISAMAMKGSFWEKTERLVDTYISTILENPDLPIFIMSELSQKKESFIEELKKQASDFKDVQSFIQLMLEEMAAGNIRNIPPAHLMLNIMGMTVFPFMAKPVFSTIFEISEEDFTELMEERKTVIMHFLKSALLVE
jgi:TetR/AcrR family transcriptional regulator